MQHVLQCHEMVKSDMVRGEGCYLFDTHGNRYADFEAGVWCTALGHGHPRIQARLQAQAAQIMHVGYRYTPAVVEEAALTVLGTLPLAGGKCTFLSSGSEAVEFAVQTTRRLAPPRRPLLLTFSGSYLAAYGSAGRRDEEAWFELDMEPCLACPRASDCDPSCDHLAAIPFHRIAAFVLEPGNTWGTVKLPPGTLVANIADKIRQHQGLIVVNEVTTGMGRTGAWWGFGHYDLEPDMVAMGKGLGNGYPISAVAMTAALAEHLEDGSFRYAQSHQNDPLGCAVAEEVIVVLREESLVARSRRVGSEFLAQLRDLADRCPGIRQIRGRGLMIAMELEHDADSPSATAMQAELLQRGQLVGANPAANLLRFYPPLVIGEEEIEGLVHDLEELLLR